MHIRKRKAFTPSMLQFYFSLQIKRLKRYIQSLGIPVLLGLLLLPLLFGALVYGVYLKLPEPSWCLTGLFLLALLQMASRKRLDYLTTLFEKRDYIQVRLIENVLVAIPFMLVLFFMQSWWQLLALFALIAGLAVWKGTGMNQSRFPTPFSKLPFEAVQNFRKTWWVHPLLYVVLWQAMLVQNVNLAVALLFVGVLSSAAAIVQPEPAYFVWVFNKSSSRFLLYKWWNVFLSSALSNAPLTIALLIFFPAAFSLIVGVFAAAQLLLAAVLFGKYSCFPRELGLLESIILGLGFWLPPLMAICAAFFYRKAKNNLKTLLS